MLAVILLPSAVTADPGLLLTVGDVTATAAVVWVRAPAPGDVAVEVTAGDGSVVAPARIAVTRDTDLTGQARVTGLASATLHRVRAQAGAAVVVASFRTAPAAEQAARVSFSWSAPRRAHPAPSHARVLVSRVHRRAAVGAPGPAPAAGPRAGAPVALRGGVYNFAHVVIEPAHLTVRLVDDGGGVMFTHTIGPE